MTHQRYQQLRLVTVMFVSTFVGIGVSSNNFLLTLAGIGTGIIFLSLVRATAKLTSDEREVVVQEKAAKLTYQIFAPSIAFTAILLLFPAKSGLAVFRSGDFLFPETLGMILAYLSCFLITLYAIAYHFINHSYGGHDLEK